MQKKSVFYQRFDARTRDSHERFDGITDARLFDSIGPFQWPKIVVRSDVLGPKTGGESANRRRIAADLLDFGTQPTTRIVRDTQ
jgi:hypothetical protein